MPIVTICFSIVFGLAFNKTRVIWIPVVFHGAVNISTEISNIGLVEESINKPLNDAIWMGLWLIAAWVCYKRIETREVQGDCRQYSNGKLDLEDH